MSGVMAPGSGPGPARLRRSCWPGQPSRAPSFVEAGPGTDQVGRPFRRCSFWYVPGVEGTRSAPGEVFPRHADRPAVVDRLGWGRGVVAAPVLGAAGALIGTRFQSTVEALAAPSVSQADGRWVRAGHRAQRCVGHRPRYEQCGRYPAVHRWQPEGQGG